MLRQTLRRNVAIARQASSAARPPRHRKPPSRTPPTPVQPALTTETTSHALSARDKVISWNKSVAWTLSGLVAAGIAFYSVQLYVAASQPCHNPGTAELAAQKDVSARYDETADSFDSEVGFSELVMGINRLRKRLAQHFTGHVLEASCGTGRNLGYYDLSPNSEIKSLTFNDLSPRMVDVCKKKLDALLGEQRDKLKPGLAIRFVTASALGNMPLAPTGKKYDTIFQTMGLCSTPSPVALLTNLAKHLDVSNPDARIFLLEHGRSYKPWLNNVLDNAAEKHAEIHGCWFNRDIGALVEDAARQAGLDVVREWRHHFGTTWVFELKPRVANTEERSASAEIMPAEEAKAYGWRGLLGWK